MTSFALGVADLVEPRLPGFDLDVRRKPFLLRATGRVATTRAVLALSLRLALGRRLSVDAVLATRLEVGPDGRLTGRFSGRNCRGGEKVRRLREHLGPDPVTLFAYGDSRGDRELLALADTAVWVGRKRTDPKRSAGG